MVNLDNFIERREDEVDRNISHRYRPASFAAGSALVERILQGLLQSIYNNAT